MIDEQTKQMVRAKVEEMLNDPTLVISSECGIVQRPNYDTGYMEGQQYTWLTRESKPLCPSQKRGGK